MRERGKLPDGRRYGIYEVFGQPVRVFDSFSAAMRCSEAMADRVLGAEGRFDVMLGLLTCDPEGFVSRFGDMSAQALLDVMGQAFGWEFGDEPGEDGGVIDWEADESRVRVTMRMAYGLGDEFEQLPYREVVDLVAMAPHETPMGQAVYYRVADAPDTDDEETLAEFERMRDHYSLGDSGGSENDSASGMFESLRSMADGR